MTETNYIYVKGTGWVPGEHRIYPDKTGTMWLVEVRKPNIGEPYFTLGVPGGIFSFIDDNLNINWPSVIRHIKAFDFSLPGAVRQDYESLDNYTHFITLVKA